MWSHIPKRRSQKWYLFSRTAALKVNVHQNRLKKRQLVPNPVFPLVGQGCDLIINVSKTFPGDSGATGGVCMHAKSLQSCLTLCDPMDCSPPNSSVLGDSKGKNTGVGGHALLQGIFPTRGLNPWLLWLLHWQVGSLLLNHQGSLSKAE